MTMFWDRHCGGPQFHRTLGLRPSDKPRNVNGGDEELDDNIDDPKSLGDGLSLVSSTPKESVTGYWPRTKGDLPFGNVFLPDATTPLPVKRPRPKLSPNWVRHGFRIVGEPIKALGECSERDDIGVVLGSRTELAFTSNSNAKRGSVGG